MIKNFGRVHNSIYSMALTSNKKVLFSCDSDGYVKKWSADSCSLLQNLGQVHETCIYSIVVTPKWLFTSDRDGLIKKFFLRAKISEPEVLIRKFVGVHTASIYSMAATQDWRFLLTSDSDGFIKRLEIGTDQWMDFGKIHETGLVLSICCTPDSKFVFTSDVKGSLKMISIDTG